ncbi:unnamed protein product [Rotaria socialis]|uniref:Uncharacterized protein n=1 Tax=Rotaria socialis TaxID=392032 RepID=A0A818L430_9BILA|nr:unnamed protein product [Rotaria socialis]
MAYNYYDEHDEDDLPVFSLPTLTVTKRTSNTTEHQEDDMPNDRSSGLLEKDWKTLYERSLHSLKSTDVIAPLVKQITHKFDQMQVNNESSVTTNNHEQRLSDDPSKLRQVTRLAPRRLTTDNSGRFPPKQRPMLPLRPIGKMKRKILRTKNNLLADLTTSKMRSTSSESLNSRIATNNSQSQRNKTGPPLSYSKYFYPPPSTTSVIKQLIGGSATLVYDSRAESRSSNTSSPDRKQQKGIQQIVDHLSSTNSNLLGRQRKPKSPDSAYATLNNVSLKSTIKIVCFVSW